MLIFKIKKNTEADGDSEASHTQLPTGFLTILNMKNLFRIRSMYKLNIFSVK